MELELRVIDLGHGRGKVVRRFPVRQGLFEFSLLSTGMDAVRSRRITKIELAGWMRREGYAPREIEIVLNLTDVPISPLAARNAYLLGYMDRNQAYQVHLDAGMSPARAELYLLIVDLVYKRKRFASSLSNNPVVISLRLEKEGMITREEGTRVLMKHLIKTGLSRWKGE